MILSIYPQVDEKTILPRSTISSHPSTAGLHLSSCTTVAANDGPAQTL